MQIACQMEVSLIEIADKSDARAVDTVIETEGGRGWAAIITQCHMREVQVSDINRVVATEELD